MRKRAAVGESLIVERIGAVTLLTINRPHRSNALDAATSAAIDSEIDAAETDHRDHAIIEQVIADLSPLIPQPVRRR